MQSTDNQNVSESLRLTPQQQRVLEALKDRETEEYPLSRWYHGALCAFHNQQNLDRISQAAQSLRELLEKLPLVVEGSDVQGSSPNFHEMRTKIYKRILKDKENYSDGWVDKQIDEHLHKTLKLVEEYLGSNQKPTRRERMQTAVTTIDPMADRFDNEIRERKRDELHGLWEQLEGFAHHKNKRNIDEFEKCLDKLENTVIDLLAPITAGNQKEIQTILKNADRCETDVENMFSLIERRGANYVFFFKHAAETRDTSWLYHLDNRDYFADPPAAEPIGNDRANYPFWWPMHYLTKMAPHALDDVIEILLRLPKTNNPRIYNEILEITLQLRESNSIKLERKILEYADLEHHFMAYRFADVLAHWTGENQTDAALKLAKALVEFVPDSQDEAKRRRRGEKPTDLDALLATLADTRLEPSPRFDGFAYRKILSDGVRPLAAKEPYKVACVLIDATANMIRLRTHQEDIGKDFDDSELWFQRLTESEDNYEDAEKSLVHTLTFASQQVYEKKPDSVDDLDDALRAQPWRIFKRLRQHLLAQYPTEMTKPWIQELIREYENYGQWEYGYEFQQMIRSACEHFGNALLTKSELKQIFDCIRNGPSIDGLTKDEIRQHQRRFHRIQFRPFATVLFDEYKTYFQKLEDEAAALISDEDYSPPNTRAGFVSTRSPRSPEDLTSLADEELLSFINEWDENEDIFEGNNLIEVNIQGLSRAFQAVLREQIISDPTRHRFWMKNYYKIERPVFVERMIDVLRECVAANNFDNLDEWLTFGEWVLSHPDDSEHGIYDRHAGESRDNPNWSNSRWAMGDFIGSCFRKDVNPPISARAQFTKLLDMFCTQFDWRLDQHLTGNKPVDASMNTPRCRALEALVGFGLWLQRNDRGSDVSEVMAILEKRLAPTAKYPLTPPEYAILGKNYNRLFYLNDAWATAYKSVLFPRDEFPKWMAAFDSFVGFNRPFEPTFEILQGDFDFALEHLPDIKKQDRPDDKLIDMLGQRLFIYYLWELYPLRREESLLERYYIATSNDREQWANLFDYVGHILWDANGQLDEYMKDRIIDFFGWRFEVREPSELQQFTYWLKAECLDARWRLNAYSKLLDAGKAEGMSVEIQIDALCEMLPDYTAEVVACFAKLTDGIRDDTIDIYTEGAKTILKSGIESSDENVRRDAARAHENLLRTGRLDLEALADELSDKFVEFVGSDSPSLSDHAASREGIYEDDL